MKKLLYLFLACALLLCACGEAANEASTASEDALESISAEESLAPDTTPPTIRILRTALEVKLKKGAEYDLLAGVKGNDDRDGDITDRIEINKGGFDPMVPGEYTVTYFLADKAGNAAEPQFKKITVVETDVLEAYPVWEGEIDGEVKNPTPAPVFGGAWYYKTVSSRDQWVGIETTVTLPELDIDRYKAEYDTSLNIDPNVQNLDNPSIYLGGNAVSESDVGLSLSKVALNSSGTLSKGSVAFRPFWRYITSEDQDVGGYDAHGGEYAVSANGDNCIANYHWKYTEYYYLPGDTLRIIVHVPEEGKMQLQIEVIEVSTLPSSIEMREKYGWEAPADFLSPVFASPGHGTGMDAEFKRVCAIDQSGNEGGTAIPTETTVTGVIWHETYLYREIDGAVYRVPMDETRRASTAAPDADKFTVTHDGVDTDKGGEVVNIHPGK